MDRNHGDSVQTGISALVVQAFDAATLLIAALLVWDVLTDHTRAGVFAYLPDIKVPFLIYGVVAFVVVRHIIDPRPTVLSRLRGLWRRLHDHPHWGPVLSAFVCTRLMIFVAAYLAVAAIGFARPSNPTLAEPLEHLPARWDAGWYGDIALFGYDLDVDNFQRERNIAFFPAMPMLMRVVGRAFGSTSSSIPRERKMGRTVWAGVFVSLCAFLLALYYFVRLASDLYGPERAGGAALLLATYPFAYFYNAPYTEGLFLLCIVAGTYHFARRQFAAAAAWGLIAGLTRPNGFLLSVPLGWLALSRYLEQRRSRRADGVQPRARFPLARALTAATMPVIGMLAFTVHLYTITGVWFAWSRSHEAWGRTYNGLLPLTRGIERLQWDGIVSVAFHYPFDTLNSLAAVFALIMTWPVARHVGVPWAIFMVAILVPPILAGGSLSLGRMTATLFPIFLALSAVLPRHAVAGCAAGFAIMQGLCAALFFTWRELY